MTRSSIPRWLLHPGRPTKCWDAGALSQAGLPDRKRSDCCRGRSSIRRSVSLRMNFPSSSPIRCPTGRWRLLPVHMLNAPLCHQDTRVAHPPSPLQLSDQLWDSIQAAPCTIPRCICCPSKTPQRQLLALDLSTPNAAWRWPRLSCGEDKEAVLTGLQLRATGYTSSECEWGSTTRATG